jgi:endonuclease/exonuclease/phosphatase family metal-dependent hydrolase
MGNDETGAPTFRVATFNVGDYDAERAEVARNRRPDPPLEGVASVIEDLSADIVLLQEISSPEYLGRLSRECGMKYTHFEEFGTTGPGLGFLSRQPLGAVALDVHRPEGPGMGAAAVQLSLSGRAVAFCNAHLPPVVKSRDAEGFVSLSLFEGMRIMHRELFRETPRSIAADVLLGAVRRLPFDTIVLGGDFNTVYPSLPIRMIRKDFLDSMSGRSGFYHGTYEKSRSILPARVDFLFYRGDLAVVDSAIVRNTPGDHYPVVATFTGSG